MDSWKPRRAVTVAGMTEHLGALQAIADEHGDRAAGRTGYEASARYVERVLHKAGYETERQYFPFQHVETLAESHPRSSTTRCASPGGVPRRAAWSARRTTSTTTAPVPPGSVETEQAFRDYFDSIGQDAVDYQFSGRSDYQAFINNGVAASGLSTGSNGLTDYEEFLFGGASGVSYDPIYHSPEDDITNVAFDAIDIQSDAIAHAVITWGTQPCRSNQPERVRVNIAWRSRHSRALATMSRRCSP